MSVIVCKQCGYENPEGTAICEICAEELGIKEANTSPVKQPVRNETESVQEVIDDGNEYYVLCPESNTKTVLPNGKVTEFFCEGCKRNHSIDGFLWVIYKKENINVQSETCTKNISREDNLWLEEINSHFRINIDKSGGTLGRYGKFGSEFFQSKNMLTVSGEHCIILYEFGNWVLKHISRTNQTVYNNMVLQSNQPTLLENGKLLVLANAVTFIVRIE